jgi:DNA-binding NarL/FixJ family response regulator
MCIRVALVEDNANLRRRFTERLGFFDAVDLVCTAPHGAAFLDRLAQMDDAARPQVVLMDIEMPEMDGLETTLRLGETHPDLDVMMLTVFHDDATIFDAIRAGASGYLLKDVATDDLVRAIEELAAGGAPMSPEVARRTLHFVQHGAPTTDPSAAAVARFELTDRELELLQHLTSDQTEAQIADALFISPHTVRTHIKNIYKKLHVHSRAAAVRIALEKRLLGR